jgi:hypothetical protein
MVNREIFANRKKNEAQKKEINFFINLKYKYISLALNQNKYIY